ARSKRLASSRRPSGTTEEDEQELEKRAARKAEAEALAQQIDAARSKRTLASLGLFSLVLLPLLVGGAFLGSTAQGTGFATGEGKMAHALADLGDVVKAGVQGWESIVTGK
ncbi:hypothetical protein HY251_22180, partial [bacterium]|nr:hypothetical protein [bacterium]